MFTSSPPRAREVCDAAAVDIKTGGGGGSDEAGDNIMCLSAKDMVTEWLVPNQGAPNSIKQPASSEVENIAEILPIEAVEQCEEPGPRQDQQGQAMEASEHQESVMMLRSSLPKSTQAQAVTGKWSPALEAIFSRSTNSQCPSQ